MTDRKTNTWRAPRGTGALGWMAWILGVATAPAWLGCQPAEFGLGSNDTPANLRNKEDADASVPEAGATSAPTAIETPNNDTSEQVESEAGALEVNERDDLGMDSAAASTPTPASVEAPARSDASVDVPTGNAGVKTDFVFDAGGESTGSADAGTGTMTLTDLPGCKREPIERTPFSDAGSCMQEFSCPEGSFSTNCHSEGAEWECYREGSYVFEAHGLLERVVVSNASSAEAACNAASLGLQPGRAAEYVPSECEVDTDCLQDLGYCYENMLCGPALRMDNGIVVRRGEVIWAGCSSDIRENDMSVCSCGGHGPNDNTFYVEPSDAAQLRDEVADFCRSPEPSAPTGATRCEPRSLSVSEGSSCTQDLLCLTGYETEEGTPLQAIQEWYLSCEDSACTCLRDYDAVQFEVEDKDDPREECEEAATLCTPNNVLEVEGGPQNCRVRGSESDPNDFVCHAVLDCEVPATLGDRNVSLIQNFPVDCDLTAEPPVCLCLTLDREVLGELTIEPGDDDPCGTATTHCLDVIEE